MASNKSGPVFEPLIAVPEKDDLSSHLHRLTIGALGFSLPPLLWTLSVLRPTSGLPRWDTLDSISAYYYSGAVAAFVGVLAALAVFLFTYQGYKNKYGLLDQVAAIVAGAAALGVAFFPTGAPEGLTEPSWWTPTTRAIHYGSALALFSSFIFFSVVLFPRSKAKALTADKKFRNFVYYACGAVMGGCMVWAGISGSKEGPIYWPESIALFTFAISWLLKGKADRTLAGAGKRAFFYGRHPGRLLVDVRAAIRR